MAVKVCHNVSYLEQIYVWLTPNLSCNALKIILILPALACSLH